MPSPDLQVIKRKRSQSIEALHHGAVGQPVEILLVVKVQTRTHHSWPSPFLVDLSLAGSQLGVLLLQVLQLVLD